LWNARGVPMWRPLSLARHWWLMPIILLTQEAEIRKILVRSQPRQEPISKKTLHSACFGTTHTKVGTIYKISKFVKWSIVKKQNKKACLASLMPLVQNQLQPKKERERETPELLSLPHFLSH
jgi:hypothetical protein